MNKAIIFIESNTSGSGIDFMKCARKLGYEPILLAHDTGLYPWASELGTLKYADTNDLEALKQCIEDLAQSFEIAAITTSSDYYVYQTTLIAAEFDKPGFTPGAVKNARDKSVMRQILSDAGLRTPKFTTIHASQQTASNLAEFTFPVVVKPASGSGSEQVKLCNTIAEAEIQIEAVLSITHNSRGQVLPSYVLVEEYIDGPEFSVEIICSPEPTPLTVVAKHLSPAPYFLEMGHDLPATLPENDYNALMSEASRAVKALNLSFGCLHVELRLSKQGPVIIEINTRLAGGMLPTLIQHCYDLDLIETQTKCALGQSPEVQSVALKQYASIRFLVPPYAGTVTSIENIKEITQDSALTSFVYDNRLSGFTTHKGDFTDRVGALICIDKNRKSCIAKVDAALASVNYIYDDQDSVINS